MRLPVVLTMPGDVKALKEPVQQELADSLLERRWIDAGATGLAGKRIEFRGLQVTITDVLVRGEMLDGQKMDNHRCILRSHGSRLSASPEGGGVASAYLRLGIEHIWIGVDHLLFILALVILVKGTRRLIATVTAFTIAHSITLAGATLGFVHVPQKPVEGCIALSIVFVASEIVHARQGWQGWTERWPWVVAFTFGLLHGFGFAGALNAVGLPNSDSGGVAVFQCGRRDRSTPLHRRDLKHHGTGAMAHSTHGHTKTSMGLARGAVQHRRGRGVLDDSTHRGVLKKLLALAAITEATTGLALLVSVPRWPAAV